MEKQKLFMLHSAYNMYNDSYYIRSMVKTYQLGNKLLKQELLSDPEYIVIVYICLNTNIYKYCLTLSFMNIHAKLHPL